MVLLLRVEAAAVVVVVARKGRFQLEKVFVILDMLVVGAEAVQAIM
jgi:hypothetical protein